MDIADGGIGIEVGRTAIENLLQDLGIGAGAHDALSLFITDGCQDTGVFINTVNSTPVFSWNLSITE